MQQLLQYLVEGWSVTLPILLVCVEVLAIASAMHALRHVRTSQATVAWVVGLITMPILTLPLYWIFGRNRFAGYREAIRDVGKRHQDSVDAIRRELTTGTNARTTSLNSPLEQVADVLDTPISDGNQFRLLIDGDAFATAVLNQIASAEHYVYAEFYIIHADEFGNRFADALIERAQQGKAVRVLFDGVGCVRLPKKYIQRLRDAGADVQSFNTRQRWINRFQINFRNHRKLLVIDGKRAIVGGLNVGDEYLGNVSWVSHWRDTSVEVSGGIVKKIQAVFASDYYWAVRNDLPEANWGDPPQGDSHSSSNTVPTEGQPTGLAAVCATGPADKRARATMMFAAAAGAARERLWISTPYLVPDDCITTALSMARARGVDVRLLIPARADHWLVYLAGFYYEQQFRDLDIPVYRYRDGFLHQKCVLVDDRLALVGSTNLDNRSLHLNFELMLAIDQTAFVAEVAVMLQRDFAASENINATSTPLRAWYVRVGTAVARLFSPVL